MPQWEDIQEIIEFTECFSSVHIFILQIDFSHFISESAGSTQAEWLYAREPGLREESALVTQQVFRETSAEGRGHAVSLSCRVSVGLIGTVTE